MTNQAGRSKDAVMIVVVAFLALLAYAIWGH
jgi:hypothetical protein